MNDRAYQFWISEQLEPDMKLSRSSAAGGRTQREPMPYTPEEIARHIREDEEHQRYIDEQERRGL